MQGMAQLYCQLSLVCLKIVVYFVSNFIPNELKVFGMNLCKYTLTLFFS